MFDENFTFDQKGVTDTSSCRRDAEEPESAMSPKEVYAELPPPPPSLEAAATQQRAAASAYANSNPPASKEATATATESDTVDSLARQLGRQTLLQEDPQYQWRRSQQPFVYEPGPFYDQRIVPRSSSPSRQSTQYIPPRPVPLQQQISNQPPSCSQPLSPPSSTDTNQIYNSSSSSPSSLPPSPEQQFETPPLQQQPHYSVMRPAGKQANNTRAIRENLIETMIANNYQCNVQNSEPATPVSASLPSFFTGAPPASSSCSSSSVTNHDGDTLMTDPTRSIQVDQDWGDDGPMVRLLSYRRAGAMTRVQKLGLSFRSAQHTALQCANLKPNKTRMRRRDRKPSKAQPTPTPAPSAVGASST
ncbi:hypothetical protein PG996_000514 [Apiospora saccharicola]|uniref:Uncharacterized protein n=1 Tax=Apiospora saccharicola TaxID=335842 RepID=A0ABR1WDY9_9PEZI